MGSLFLDIYFTRFKDDRRAIKAFGDCCNCSLLDCIRIPPLVTIVLLLETLMTALVFLAFWISSEPTQHDLGSWITTGIPTPTVVASVTGTGEQQIVSGRSVVN